LTRLKILRATPSLSYWWKRGLPSRSERNSSGRCQDCSLWRYRKHEGGTPTGFGQ
jgi:hypothetical protein